MHLFHCPNMVPVAGVEPARVISPTDFESASSANSNTPASIILSRPPNTPAGKRRDIWRDIKTKALIQFVKKPRKIKGLRHSGMKRRCRF